MKNFNYCALLTTLLAASSAQLNATPIFGIESVDQGQGVSSQAPTTLYRFDSTAGVYSGYADIGRVRYGTTNIHADGLAYSGRQGLFAFELSGGQSRLISIDTDDAQATAVGSFVAGDFRGAAFRGSVLVAIDSASNRLVTVDTATGSVLSAVNLTLGAGAYNLGNAVDVVVGADNNVYVVEGGRSAAAAITTGNNVNGTNFFAVNFSTGAMTLLAQDLVNSAVNGGRVVATGAAFEPGTTLLHVAEMNGADGLFRYTAPNATGRVLLQGEIVAPNSGPGGSNSGRGDLASDSAPVPEPSTISMLASAGVLLALGLRRRS